MGGLMGSVPFSHSVFLKPSGRDLRFVLIANYQSEVSNKRRLEELVGGTSKIL
jgi:hypothetical protein